MVVVRQSDLSSFSYCGMRQHLDRLGRENGFEERRLSAAIFGSVFHYAGMVMQQRHNQGDPEALAIAQATFEHYWAADHVAEVTDGPITDWMRGHTWAGLLAQGRSSLAEMYRWLQTDEKKHTLLAVEQTFDLPFTLDGEEHVFHGTADAIRLGIEAGRFYVMVDDLKTGIKPDHLQLANQWSAYSWASLQPAFWTPFLEVEGFDRVVALLADKGQALYDDGQGLAVVGRRGRWLAARDGKFTAHNCGWRTEQHYNRLFATVREYIRAQRAGVHPLTTDTKKCFYCPWRDSCAQAPLPDYQEGVDD